MLIAVNTYVPYCDRIQQLQNNQPTVTFQYLLLTGIVSGSLINILFCQPLFSTDRDREISFPRPCQIRLVSDVCNCFGAVFSLKICSCSGINVDYFLPWKWIIMPRNVEVKAKIKDFNKIISIAKKLCGEDAKLLKQEDTFFTVSQGRLKLRHFQDESKSELIYYNRPDEEGAKISDYSICSVDNYKELLNVLKLSLGVKGTVKKTRHLFLFGQTRIHIDQVEGLGNFAELEVVLTPNQSLKEGEEIANDLMNKLEISEEDLIKGAYVDLINQNKI